MPKQTVTVRNARDTFVNQLEPGRNYNNVTRLTVRGAQTNRRRWAYIFFPLRFLIGSNVTVTDAKLRLYMRGDKSGSLTCRVRRITENWGVNRINWNNKPDVGPFEDSVTHNGNKHNQMWEFDVKDQLNEVAAGEPWYGWRVAMDEDEIAFFHSSLAPDRFKPELTVTYTEKPDRPTGLSPGGNRFVSDPSPVLSFNFLDDAGNTEKAAHWIQLGTDEDLEAQENAGTLLHDTGVVTTVRAQHDLSEDAGWTPMTAADRIWWRVSVRDGAGNWSGWSEPSSFRYDPKGTLTMVSPTGDVTYDNTPTVSWTLSGATQSQWQIAVRNRRGKTVYESDKFTSSDTSWQIPAKNSRGHKIIHDRTHMYTIILRVWDTVDREDTVGKPAVYVATNDVQFQPNPDALAEKPSGIQVTDLNGKPGVKVSWTRSTSPDTWVISRDDEIIDTLENDDVWVSGTSYEYIDYSARPGRAYTYKIGAKVNNKVYEAQKSMTQPVSVPDGIWLIDNDPDEPILVQIMGDDEGDWEMPETSAVYSPLNASSSRIVTQQLRGYEGNITGMLMERDDRTVEQQEEDMFELKARPGRTYYLVASDVAMPVIINNVQVAPTPYKDIVKNVSFDFYQQGEPFFGLD